MNTHWISRLAGLAARAWTAIPSVGGRYGGYHEGDADSRRVQSELLAIRARFPDHA